MEEYACEVAFFTLGVIPWWFVLARPSKDRIFWGMYLYVWLIWSVYYSVIHWAPAGLVNNVIELPIVYVIWKYANADIPQRLCSREQR